MSMNTLPSHRKKLGILATASALLMAGLVQTAQALGQGSTMSEWSAASEDDQKRFLETLGPSFKTREAEILACLNLAAQSSAHADLPVVEIAKACAAPPDPSDGEDQKSI